MQARMKQMRRRWRGVIFFSSEIILIFSSNLRGIGTYFVGRAVSTKSIAHEIIISSDIFGTKEVIWTIFRNKDNIFYVTQEGNRIKIKVMDQMFLVGFKNHNIGTYFEWVMHRPKKITYGNVSPLVFPSFQKRWRYQRRADCYTLTMAPPIFHPWNFC